MDLQRHRPIVAFLCGFVLVYGLLIVAWPGFNEAYAAYLRELGRLAFVRNDSQRILRFDPAKQPARKNLTTRIIIGNRQQIDGEGNFPATVLQVDTRLIGSMPTALVVALITATPIAWKRRAWALLWGVLCIHAYILFCLGIWIWNQSTNASLVTLTPFWKAVAEGLEYTLIVQQGASFAVPVLIWLLVTFRREDIRLLDMMLKSTPLKGRSVKQKEAKAE